MVTVVSLVIAIGTTEFTNFRRVLTIVRRGGHCCNFLTPLVHRASEFVNLLVKHFVGHVRDGKSCLQTQLPPFFIHNKQKQLGCESEQLSMGDRGDTYRRALNFFTQISLNRD